MASLVLLLASASAFYGDPPPPSPPLQPGCTCTNECIGAADYAQDSICDDGGSGSSYSECGLGTDCDDCGYQIRCGDTPLPPPFPPLPPSSPVPLPPPPPLFPGCQCTNECLRNPQFGSDGVCDDGGSGSAYSDCDRGTDCADCGAIRCPEPPPPGHPPLPPPPPVRPPPPLEPPLSPCVYAGAAADAVTLNFDNATLLSSNLGGQGGRGSTPATPPVLRLGNVGQLLNGTRLDLEITNMTEYRAFRAANNGLKQKSGGSFGVVNLLAAQASEGGTGGGGTSDDAGAASFVQLRFTFVDAPSGQPVTLGRTHVTFVDFDVSQYGLRECMQVITC